MSCLRCTGLCIGGRESLSLLVCVGSTTVPHRLYTADVGMDVDYTVEVRYQGRNVNMQQGIVKDFIGPYATAILRFPPPTSRCVPPSSHIHTHSHRSTTHHCGVRSQTQLSVGPAMSVSGLPSSTQCLACQHPGEPLL